jgi:thiol-disulfide isomerase/thioredoxin
VALRGHGKLDWALRWWWVLAVAAAVVWWINHQRDSSVLQEGSRAPELVTTLDDGRELRLSSMKGSTVVVNFWGTYCPPCRAEAPTLSRVHADLKKRGGQVIGVAVDRAPLGYVVGAARRFGMTYPIGLASPDSMQRFKVAVVPTTYVVSPNGTIVQASVGAVSEDELRDAIDDAMEKAEASNLR